MRDRKLDRLFARFRSHGDVQALGQVFDATAPELLRVAASLVRDANEADDLLQQTFLTAIERCERYDGARRLVPWLLGILAHHARESRRREGRALDPVRLGEPPVAHPVQRAAALELEDELDRALGKLSTRERFVLEAHLRLGKTAPEIASEIGAAPGAVRMQIHRGLEHLRRALPAGLAAGVAGSALGAQGTAAVRESVLRAGREAAARLAPGAGSALGTAGTAGTLMHTKLILAGILVALAAGMWWLRSTGERGGADTREEVAEARASEPERAAASAGLERRSSAATAMPSQPSASRAPVSGGAPDRAVLRGRVLEPDGAPVAAVDVALLELDEAQLFSLALEAAPAPQLLAAETRTDAQGVFELGGARPRALHALGIDLGGARATLRVLDASCEPGETTDLGDVVLAPAGALEGRVVDEELRPLAGVRVRVGPLSGELARYGLPELVAGGAFGAVDERGGGVTLFELPDWISALEPRLPLATTTSGADGRFALERVPAGSLAVLLDRPGRAPRLARSIELAAGAREDLGDLELGAGRALSGRVLDERGAPVAGAEVRAGRIGEVPISVFAPARTTGADGCFSFTGLSDVGAPEVIARRDALGAWHGCPAANDSSAVLMPSAESLRMNAR